MSHFVSTKPFFILTNVPTALGFVYSANEIGEEILCNEEYTFTEYDTEEEFANAVDALKGEPGWGIFLRDARQKRLDIILQVLKYAILYYLQVQALEHFFFP